MNREPSRPIEPPPPKEQMDELRKHKARIFDRKSYYYLRVELLKLDQAQKLMDKNYNVPVNSRLLDAEFAQQTEYFLEKGSIKDYISEKPMIREYKRGELLTDLFPEKIQKNLEWF